MSAFAATMIAIYGTEAVILIAELGVYAALKVLKKRHG